MKDFWSNFCSAFVFGVVVAYLSRIIGDWLSNRRK